MRVVAVQLQDAVQGDVQFGRPVQHLVTLLGSPAAVLDVFFS
jgi:hypothetical protein